MQASVVGACPKPGESGRVAAGRASGIKMGDEGDAPLISPCGVAPSLMVCVSASGYLPLHQKKSRKIYSGTSSPGWSRKRAIKCVCVFCFLESKKVIYFQQH